jgi:hypothetical protein
VIARTQIGLGKTLKKIELNELKQHKPWFDEEC